MCCVLLLRGSNKKPYGKFDCHNPFHRFMQMRTTSKQTKQKNRRITRFEIEIEYTFVLVVWVDVCAGTMRLEIGDIYIYVIFTYAEKDVLFLQLLLVRLTVLPEGHFCVCHVALTNWLFSFPLPSAAAVIWLCAWLLYPSCHSHMTAHTQLIFSFRCIQFPFILWQHFFVFRRLYSVYQKQQECFYCMPTNAYPLRHSEQQLNTEKIHACSKSNVHLTSQNKNVQRNSHSLPFGVRCVSQPPVSWPFWHVCLPC